MSMKTVRNVNTVLRTVLLVNQVVKVIGGNNGNKRRVSKKS